MRRSLCNVSIILVKILMTLEFPHNFSKHSETHNFIKIRSLGAEVFYVERQTKGRIDRQAGRQIGR